MVAKDKYHGNVPLLRAQQLKTDGLISRNKLLLTWFISSEIFCQLI